MNENSCDPYPANLNSPLAYLITWSCYGTHLWGSRAGSVDRRHNLYGSPLVRRNDQRNRSLERRLQEPPFRLDAPRREVVLQAVCDECQQRGWALRACHVRQSHVHSVVESTIAGTTTRSVLKSAASRYLSRRGFDLTRRKRWTAKGSVRPLWTAKQVAAAVEYVVNRQGRAMAVYEEPGWGE